jgi:hypothetical protein
MMRSSDYYNGEPFHKKCPETGDSASILSMNLATSDGDLVKNMVTLGLLDVKPESSNSLFSMVKLSVESIKTD